MQKLIVKTALITFASAIGALILFALVCMLFFPSAVSDAAYNMGMDNISVTFAERAYKNGGDEKSLKTLVDRAAQAENYTAVVTYAQIFVDSDYFAQAVESEDSNIGQTSGSYYGYITGHLAVAYYNMGDKDAALQTIAEHSGEGKYVRYNAAEYLILEVISKNDKDFATVLMGELLSLELEGDEATLLAEDISMLQTFLN